MLKSFRYISTTLATTAIIMLSGNINLASAQYIISARGGLVNYTTGPVSYRSDDSSWKEVSPELQLNVGDRIKTEDFGKAELLLNPGSFLRIGNGAEVIMQNTDLGAGAIELLSGSAILEVANLPDGGTLTVQTPVTTVRIKKEGLYRVDVISDAITLTVRQGEAFFLQADNTLEKVKKKKRALIIGGQSQIAKFDPDQVDDFDLWSADRAELLIAANQSFVQRMGSWSWPRLQWSAWVFDPFYGFYTFFPWGASNWSPYGYGYYNPWYRVGYWGGGGGFVRGQVGSSGPGGTPPTRSIKPSIDDRIRVGKEPKGSIRSTGDNGYGQQSGRNSNQGSWGSFGGSIRGSASSGHGSVGIKSGGISGTPVTGASGGHASGVGKAGGGNGKRH
jgi:hypothetical protein